MPLGPLACSRSSRYVATSSSPSRTTITGHTTNCSPTTLALTPSSSSSFPNLSQRILPRDTVDLVVFLVVFDVQRLPVLLAEIKEDAWITRLDLRFKADDHMPQRYDSMLATCPLPRLWGLSLLGTSLRVYCGDRRSRSCVRRPPKPWPHPFNLLEGAWSIDILSQEGFAKMKEIVGDSVGNAGAL